jgi:hypothetical protein
MVYYVIGIAILVGIFFLLKTFTSSSGAIKNVAYIHKDDPNAQTNYEKLKHPNAKILSASELLELSWKFLYALTDIILQKFSSRDQQQVMEQGRTLVQYGMKYQHIIEDDPDIIELYTKKLSEQQKEGQQTQR